MRDSGCERQDQAGNRRLYMDEYCELVILALLNPMINSLRTLQKTIGLDHVANTLGIRRFSLGSFSESPRVFEPQRLKAVIDELAKELRPLSKDPRLSELEGCADVGGQHDSGGIEARPGTAGGGGGGSPLQHLA